MNSLTKTLRNLCYKFFFFLFWRSCQFRQFIRQGLSSLKVRLLHIQCAWLMWITLLFYFILFLWSCHFRQFVRKALSSLKVSPALHSMCQMCVFNVWIIDKGNETVATVHTYEILVVHPCSQFKPLHIYPACIGSGQTLILIRVIYCWIESPFSGWLNKNKVLCQKLSTRKPSILFKLCDERWSQASYALSLHLIVVCTWVGI